MSFKTDNVLIGEVIILVITVAGDLRDPLIDQRINAGMGAVLSEEIAPRYVVMDVSGLKHIDSAFFGKLIAMHLRCEKARGNFLIVGPNDHLKERIQIFKLDEDLLVFDGISSALQHLDQLWDGTN
jgi:anti-anti-sigma regulatory factor